MYFETSYYAARYSWPFASIIDKGTLLEAVHEVEDQLSLIRILRQMNQVIYVSTHEVYSSYLAKAIRKRYDQSGKITALVTKQSSICPESERAQE